MDATTSDVYSKIRRGGDFDVLVENLEYIRDVVKVQDFAVSTVIQRDNYHQLSEFITFAKKFNCNRLQYQIFEPDFRLWGESDYLTEWKDKAVQEKTNPYHQDLLKYIHEIQLEHSDLGIDFGPLLNLKNGIDISQLETVEREHKNRWNDEVKSVWFNSEVHYVLRQNVKKIIKNDIETDAVYIDKIKTYVYWNHDRQKWVDMNEN